MFIVLVGKENELNDPLISMFRAKITLYMYQYISIPASRLASAQSCAGWVEASGEAGEKVSRPCSRSWQLRGIGYRARQREKERLRNPLADRELGPLQTEMW